MPMSLCTGRLYAEAAVAAATPSRTKLIVSHRNTSQCGAMACARQSGHTISSEHRGLMGTKALVKQKSPENQSVHTMRCTFRPTTFSSVQFSSVQPYALVLRLMLVGIWLGLHWVLFYFFDHYIQSSTISPGRTLAPRFNHIHVNYHTGTGMLK